MVWGFCYLRIFKKVQSISGRSLPTRQRFDNCLDIKKIQLYVQSFYEHGASNLEKPLV
jgi:hypothetical protein